MEFLLARGTHKVCDARIANPNPTRISQNNDHSRGNVRVRGWLVFILVEASVSDAPEKTKNNHAPTIWPGLLLPPDQKLAII